VDTDSVYLFCAPDCRRAFADIPRLLSRVIIVSMESGDKLTPRSRLWGDGFQAVDSLANEFPKIDVEKVRNEIETALKQIELKGYTGVEEEIEFDEHGLLVGKYHHQSFVTGVRLRTKDDLMKLFDKIGEGRNFDAHFWFDSATRKAKISCTLKKHTLVPKIYTYQGRIRE